MSSSTEENNIKLSGVYQDKKSSKGRSFLFVLLLLALIIISIVIAGFFGSDFLTFYVFVLIFGFPLVLIYRDAIVGILPENVSTWFFGELEDVPDQLKTEIGKPSSVFVPVSKKEYQTLFLGCLSLVISIYLMIKKNDQLISILLSAFFAVLANIILGDLF